MKVPLILAFFCVALAVALVLLVFVPRSGEGSRQAVLPQGDPVAGAEVFAKYRCQRCHTVEGRAGGDEDLPARIQVHLGGGAARAWTVDDYARAIVTPAHTMSLDYLEQLRQIGGGDGTSPMPTLNGELSVRELIDLTAYLRGRDGP